MYLDALSFLEDERDAWRSYEALAELTDEQLEKPIEGAHGWSGRDLIAHLVGWHEITLDIARELAVDETSRARERIDREWEARGDAWNADIIAAWAALPMDEVRQRMRTVPGELRGYLTVIPEARWLKHPTHFASFLDVTVDHYDDHRLDLEAILAAGR
ncbi:MAG: maleylpyruvate isomerase N-terminal domain-containing protein [Chloroflexota bacterium]|nr:maleylpyruvate isomerase N-terminal domain-containing protein [Chloroflexota bacterium]